MHESEKWKWSRSVVSYSLKPYGLQPIRLLHPWDFPGKSTGVGCHRLLCITVRYKANASGGINISMNGVFCLFFSWSCHLTEGEYFYYNNPSTNPKIYLIWLGEKRISGYTTTSKPIIWSLLLKMCKWGVALSLSYLKRKKKKAWWEPAKTKTKKL